MADKILLKRSLTPGNLPSTSSLVEGELAINVPDGKLFLKQSGSSAEAVRSLLTLDTQASGNILLTGSVQLTDGMTAFSYTSTAGTSVGFIGTSSYANNADKLDGYDSTIFATTGSNTFTGQQSIVDATPSSNISEGALIVSGGVAVKQNLNVGQTLAVNENITAPSASITVLNTTTGSFELLGVGETPVYPLDVRYATGSDGVHALIGYDTLDGVTVWDGVYQENHPLRGLPGITALDSSMFSVVTTKPYGGISDDEYYQFVNYLNLTNYLDNDDENVYGSLNYINYSSSFSQSAAVYGVANSIANTDGFMSNTFGNYTVVRTAGPYARTNNTVSTYGWVQAANTASINTSYAYRAQTDASVSASINTAYQYHATTNVQTSGSINNLYGVYLTTSGVPGGIINKYGAIVVTPGILTASNNTFLLFGTPNVPMGNWSIYDSSSNDSFFRGNITASQFYGTASWGTTASLALQAVTASYALPSGLPAGTVSSSAQINTGSFSGSFVGVFTGSASLTGSYTGSFTGDGSNLTGLVTDLRISGSTGSDTVSLLTDTLLITGSNGVTTIVTNNKVTIGIPQNTVSSSAQVTSFLPDGTVSASSQVNITGTTGYGTFSSSLASTDATQSAQLSALQGATGSYASTGSNTFVGPITISDATNSTAYNNGALVVVGGVGIGKDVNISGSVNITGLLTVTSMSTQYVTSSQLNVADNKITVQTNDVTRFGGISVYDSGSVSPSTASIYWDSLNHKFIYENISSAPYNSAMFIAGPKNTGTLGTEVGLTDFRVPVAHGSDHIDSRVESSSIRVDFPSRFTSIEAGLYVTGAITSSVGFSGNGANITNVTATSVDYTNITNKPTLVSQSIQIDHNATTNYTASRHVDHTAVSITAGDGLNGGGDISATRTLSVNSGSMLPYYSSSIFSRISGDILINAGGVATIQANSVALGTDTTGDYVSTITAGNGVLTSGTTSGETVAHTISLDTGSTHFIQGARGTISVSDTTGASGIDLTYNSTTGVLSGTLQNSSLTVTAGNGLSGGGAVSLGGTVTVDAVAGNGISLTVPTNDAINLDTGSTHFTSGVKTKMNTDVVHSGSYLGTATTTNLTEGTNLYYTDARVKTKLNTEGVISSSAQVDHNLTTNYVANRHIDHTAVSITAGSGLLGGGDISSTRTLSVDSGSMLPYYSSSIFSKISGDILINSATGVATIQADSVALGTDTTGNYAASISAGSGISVGGSAGEGTTFTVTLDTSSAHFIQGARGTFSVSDTTGASGIDLTYSSATGVLSGVLQNSSITVGSTAISLGGTATTIAGLTSITSTTVSGSAGSFTGNVTALSFTETSTIKFKQDVRPLEQTNIHSLEPVRFKWKETNKEDIGLIAEQVAPLYPELVEFDNDGNPIGIHYTKLTVLLLKAVQDLSNEITSLKGHL